MHSSLGNKSETLSKKKKRIKQKLWAEKCNNAIGILKNASESFNSRIDQVEERIGELEDRVFENTQSEGQRKKNLKNEVHL